MNPLPEILRALGLDSPWGYLGLFLAASLLMVWRMEGLLAHGLEGTALGTLVMPYCSGLGTSCSWRWWRGGRTVGRRS